MFNPFVFKKSSPDLASGQVISVMDVGSSKSSLASVLVRPDGSKKVLGASTSLTNGIKGGTIVDIEAVVKSLRDLVSKFESENKLSVNEVVVNISGNHVSGIDATGMVPVRNGEVSKADVEVVLNTATAGCHLSDQQVLHVIPKDFTVDGQMGIQDPVGMFGARLDVRAHIVTVGISAAQNLMKCLRRAGLEPVDIVLQSMASARSVLHSDDKEIGACVIDIGAGTTDVVVYSEDSILHTSSIPIGGNQITNDISRALAVSRAQAEEMKIKSGFAAIWLADPDVIVHVPANITRGARDISSQALAEVISPRVREIFDLVQADLERAGISKKNTGEFVITGGSSAMPGFIEMAEEVFVAPVRLANPTKIEGMPEAMSGAASASLYGLVDFAVDRTKHESDKYKNTPAIMRRVHGLKAWASESF